MKGSNARLVKKAKARFKKRRHEMRINVILALILFLVMNIGSFSNWAIGSEFELKISKKEAWGKEYEIKFTPKLTIGTDDYDKENYIFGGISDIETDDEGNIYISDYINCRVQKYSPTGEYLFTFGNGKGQGPGQFQRPRYIALDSKRNLYVVDINQSKVLIFDSSGRFDREIITQNRPGKIALGKDSMFLTTWLNKADDSVVEYDLSSGKKIRTLCRVDPKQSIPIGRAGETDSVCTDSEGYLYCNLFYPYEIRKYSPQGEELLRFSRKESFYGPPQPDKNGVMFMLSGSMTIDIFPDGKIINVIKHGKKRGNKITLEFYFDFFSPSGEWLKTVSSSAVESNWVRLVEIDTSGNLYLDYINPYPHIKKYSVEVIKK